MQTTLTAIGNQRQSVSGVSLDEEMTNLISFQRGYQASARTLTAMDEMLETADRAHRKGGAVGMYNRITGTMLTGSTLNDINSALAKLAAQLERTLLGHARSSSPPTTPTGRAARSTCRASSTG